MIIIQNTWYVSLAKKTNTISNVAKTVACRGIFNGREGGGVLLLIYIYINSGGTTKGTNKGIYRTMGGYNP